MWKTKIQEISKNICENGNLNHEKKSLQTNIFFTKQK